MKVKKNRYNIPCFCFRRWTNKSYAVFNSLNRCWKIGVLFAGYSMLISPLLCFAQTDTMQIKKIELEEVTVSAEAPPDVFAPIGRTITQVQKIEIERAPVQNLVDLLNFIPNVDLRQRGPLGAQADISIRGSSFDQTLILLNGINITDPQTGHYSLNLPIDLESVEKIEVLEGSAARIFGNNALGGVVNFITGTQPTNTMKASVAGGQYGFYRASLAGTAHTRRTTHHLAVSRTASDGYTHNTDFKNTMAFLQNKLNNSVVPLDLQVGFTQKDFGANSFYGARWRDQHELLHTFFTALKTDVTTGRLSISPSVYWRRNHNQYTLIRDNPDFYRNFHFTDICGANIITSLPNRFGRASAGILFSAERIHSNNLGLPMGGDTIRKGARWYNKTDQRANISAYIEQNLHIGNWSASLGVLANHNNYTGAIKAYPGIDVAFRPNDMLRIHASANRAMRLPTFTDLYYTSPDHMVNPDELKPERSTEYELGTRITLSSWNFNVVYFYRTVSDAIAWVRDPVEQKSYTNNFTTVTFHGISTGGRWDLRRYAGEDFPVQWLAANYSFMHGDRSAPSQYVSEYEMTYLRHKLNFSVTHRIFEKVNAHWQICWQDRNGGYLQYNVENSVFDTEQTPFKSFWKIDLRICRQTERLNIFVEASNLGNSQQRDFGNIALPGRWIRAGMALTLTTKN